MLYTYYLLQAIVLSSLVLAAVVVAAALALRRHLIAHMKLVLKNSSPQYRKARRFKV